jgi:hypothetical protein
VKFALPIVAFAILMAAIDAVEGLVPRVLLGAAGVAVAFAIEQTTSGSSSQTRHSSPH